MTVDRRMIELYNEYVHTALPRREFIARLTTRMEEEMPRIKDYMDLIFIARFLERAGDHAVNIGEDAVYAGAARDIRHVK